MTINFQKNISLKPYNTLGISVLAKHFVKVDNAEQLPQALNYATLHRLDVLVLGGGSNIVLTQDFQGLVIYLNNQGFESETFGDEVLVTASAGQNWHQFILRCLAQGFYGLENLALIPGNVGAAPIQNIGAYGVEIKDVFHSLTGWHRGKKQWQTLHKAQCEFGYRDSIFKKTLKDQFIITEVSFMLSRKPNTILTYKELADYLQERHITNPTPYQLAESVISIRSKKLPAPHVLPNAGSFFKNPVVDKKLFDQLVEKYPDIVYYTENSNFYKLAAGWLLEKAGWKGREKGLLSMHKKQALVMVNRGGTGAEVLEFAIEIQADIARKFSVKLEIEPRLY